ncbi:MAG: hypothetical protein SGILL_002595 [Bacillariaceae sp.]
MAKAASPSKKAAGSPSKKPLSPSKKKVAPQIDTKDAEKTASTAATSASQARTPKHANKTKDDGKPTPVAAKAEAAAAKTEAPVKGEKSPPGAGHPQQQPPRGFPPRPPFAAGGGAFQPHEPRRDQGFYTNSPMQVSPGAYPNRNGPPPGYYDRRGPPPPPPPGYYERGYAEYGAPPPMMRRPPQMAYQGYPERGQPFPPQSFQGYDQRGFPPPHQGGFDPYHRPPPGHPEYQEGYPPRGDPNSNFSRAVSSSFDRSVKEKPAVAKPAEGATSGDKEMSTGEEGQATGDASMASDDISWKQLKQVHSIDDAAIQEHLGLKKKDDTDKPGNQDDDSRHPPSNSSSLTNSPTEGAERRSKNAVSVVAAAAAAAASTSKQQSSLDELSSIASAQAPMDTSGSGKTEKAGVPPASPATHDSGSLDLMKCSSGSSLLLPPHQRDEGLSMDGKRTRDEERGDSNTATVATATGEIRRAPSATDEKQPNKKVRIEGSEMEGTKDGKAAKKESDSSITCSPSADKAKKAGDARKGPNSKGDNSFYDRPPSYTYSMESAPSIPTSNIAGRLKQPPAPNTGLPPRPGSSSSSTMTPGQMQIDNQDPANAVVSSIPSWEIHAQDSFGAGSVGGGHGLANNFSFQDYPMLSASESNLGNVEGGPPGPPMSMRGPPPPHGPPPLESRNQSFEGGHYHGGGSFHRNDSMDISYGGRPPYGHNGPFPPHAPSWGTAGSAGSYQGPPPGHPAFQGGRMGDYPIMRNYSQESAHRASPPPGPPGVPGSQWGRPPSNFEPPPEFAAPHNMTRRPPPAVYIMSSQGAHPATKRGGGVFSWSKEDDMRLSEIMKKYKNPRDWEPIAKEHGMGKSAKECHERWIRYLKPGVRKGQWTDQEDAIVIEAVTQSSEQPFTRWSDLAQRLPGRVGKQIRDRWVNHLNPNINHLPFSRDDDLLLWDGHKKLGKRWVEISTKLFNSTRSENHIKNRWYSASFKKFISNEFGPDAYSGGKASKGKDDRKTKKSMKKNDDPALRAVGV